MKTMRIIMAAAGALAFGVGPGLASDYRLTLTDAGMREYYCTIAVTLTNETEAPLTEVSGFFHSYVGDREVGRSKGSWFMNVAPGGSATAVFETPNAPCEAVERYVFVLGACRIGAAFEDKASCAARIGGDAPIEVTAGS